MDLHERLARVEGFEWDAGNAEKDWHTHRVSSAESEQIFFNQPLVIVADKVHSRDEERFLALGRSNAGRLLFVAFTLRSNRIRVISARNMSRKERKAYGSHG